MKKITLAPGTVKKVLQVLRPYKITALLSILLSAVYVALSLYVPVLIGRAIDLILGPGNVDLKAIVQLLVTVGIVVASGAVTQWLINTINNRIVYHVIRDVRNEAFAHLQVLPLSYLDAHPAGDIVSRMIADVDQFADGLLLGFTQLFTGVVTILGTLVFMLSIRASIAAIVVLLTPLSFVVARFIATRTHDMFVLQSKTRGEQTAFIDEMLGNQKVVRAFGHEKENQERFDEINGRLQKASLQAIFFSSLTNPCTRFVNNVVYAAVALAGGLICLATAGAAVPFTVGALSALLSYANQYTKPFNEISGVITELQNALVCAGRVFELLAVPARVPDKEDAVVLQNVEGCVEAHDVSFSYTPGQKLIEHMNLSAEHGQHIAIVGPTGCGKTTLINLLMRFYDVNAGAVTVDGHDIRLCTRKSLRGSYGMVLQDTWLRRGTIRENITMGKPDATEQQIIEAAKAAHAHSFIQRLPNGYDTVIGEDGGLLSQGQKQLLCIARVMLCLPPMLILDEATSSIDTRTEIKIQNAFTSMMQGRTTFIVAHRLSTIREADLILVMKDGRIVEQGNHEQLLNANGFYATLYNSQFAS
ncbi:MAG: ABC transporter ATP-binding protein/permease [Clostridia bacterium]|nr:ABC transporter ATP-binding protein/permease [Clostridia bacterium]